MTWEEGLERIRKEREYLEQRLAALVLDELKTALAGQCSCTVGACLHHKIRVAVSERQWKVKADLEEIARRSRLHVDTHFWAEPSYLQGLLDGIGSLAAHALEALK